MRTVWNGKRTSRGGVSEAWPNARGISETTRPCKGRVLSNGRGPRHGRNERNGCWFTSATNREDRVWSSVRERRMGACRSADEYEGQRRTGARKGLPLLLVGSRGRGGLGAGCCENRTRVGQCTSWPTACDWPVGPGALDDAASALLVKWARTTRS